MPKITLQSPAKINLSLRITGKREDGFHEIRTKLCKIELHDTVEITQLRDGEPTVLTCNDPAVPVNETNLALLALQLVERKIETRRSWHIHLEKRIPAGAGLGGGSSNAAAVLRGLNQMLGAPLTEAQLHSLAAQIGSDVPFFLLDKSAAVGTGRGEIVAPISFPWQLPVVIIKPPFPIPTPWAYQKWATSRQLKGVLYAPQICPWGEMVNDLERPVFEKYLLLPTLKSKLLEGGSTVAAHMSGSGSTMFAVTKTAAAAEELAVQAREWCGATAFIEVTHTIPSIK